jgi:hypothetical protein
MSENKRIILSSLGTGQPRETDYSLDGEVARTYYSSLAVRSLVPELRETGEVWFVLTEKAAEIHWEGIQEESRKWNFPVNKIDIVGNEDDVHEFLTKTAEALPDRCSLTLNITEGFRHHAFLYYALALYLTSFRSITIDGVWYCRYEGDSPLKPLISLQSVFDLANWFYGLRLERETGSYTGIAQMTQDPTLTETLKDLSQNIMNGLPIDAGVKATELCERMSANSIIEGIPFSDELNERIKTVASELATEQKSVSARLSNPELERQARLIDRYFDRGQWNLAFGLLKEYIVNWIALKECPDQWLERDERMKIERKLGLMHHVQSTKSKTHSGKKERRFKALYESMTDNQKAWSSRWNALTGLRNKLQHHGMNKSQDRLDPTKITDMRSFWESRNTWTDEYQFGRGTGKLLICPLGNSPGVLFSALQHIHPDRLIVVCSKSTQGFVAEAIEKVRAMHDQTDEPHLETQELIMDDPHAGIGEFDPLMESSFKWLAESDEVIANLTGGTSLMGVLVSRLVKEAENLQKRVQEFVLIDKRPFEQQQKNPWELGAINYLR